MCDLILAGPEKHEPDTRRFASWLRLLSGATLLGLVRPALCGKKLGRRCAQRPSEREDRLESCVALSAFDASNIISVQLRGRRELFLTQLPRAPQAPHFSPKCNEIAVSRHIAELAGLRLALYTL